MIQFLADSIDQLDLTLDQLAVSDRNFDRFAFMLIDNVVELLLHRHAQDKAGENELWGKLGKPKHDPKVIEKALSQNFDEKIKATSKLGLINSTVCESILNLHAFRNTAYHKGLRHEKILHSLAVFYFRNAITLLKAYKPRGWSWSSRDRISHRAMKYIGKQTFLDHEESFQAAYTRLDQVCSEIKEDLVGDLSSDMANTIKATDDAISFIAKDSPVQLTRIQVVIDSQVWPFSFTEEAAEFAKSNGYVGNNMAAYVEWLAKNYKWEIKNDPIPSWQKRYKALTVENDYHKALKRYCDFMKQTESIRSKITEAAVQLDDYIQHQIDIARGK